MSPSSHSANQAKPEPFPASATGSETETPASDHPQGPSGTTGGGPGHVGDPASVPSTSDQPAPGSSEENPVVRGLHQPEVEEPEPRT